MLSFYTFPEAVRAAYSVIAILCVVASAVGFILHVYRFNRGLLFGCEAALSVLLLCQSLLCVALIAQVQMNFVIGWRTAGGYEFLRYATGAAMIAVSVYPCINRRFLLPAASALSSCLTLPVMEVWFGKLFPVAYTAALCLQLVAGIWIAVSLYRELQTSLSGLSVKQAMDSLPTAVLFYKRNGQILLQNTRMQELMVQTAGRVIYNGKHYLEHVVIPNSKQASEGHYLYQLAGSVWLFTVKDITLGRLPVTQLTSTDVTEPNRVNLLLQAQLETLNARQDELKSYIETVEEIYHAEELLRIKTETHDAQNQKLTLLFRYLRQGERPPTDIISAVGTSLLRGIQKSGAATADPWTRLDTLVGVYAQTGLNIIVSGGLPSDREQALVLNHVLQEAAANAILHGHATELYADITTENGVIMRVTDNSELPPRMTREGSGIAEMRRQLAPLGGELVIDTTPRFTLTVTIIGKGEHSG